MNESGIILINKPAGITSHDVISQLRRLTGIKKIGHAGTLDPLATGVLICAIGRESTKRLHEFQKLDKEYEAKVRLDGVSDTYDAEGEIRQLSIDKPPTERLIKKCVQGFIGKIMQTPPIFSAKKIKGQPAYRLARKGQAVKLLPVEIEVYSIEILDYKWPLLSLKISCSTGTYIRSLANDIGEKLGVGGYLTNLVRTKIGSLGLSKTVQLNDLNVSNWANYLEKD